jgi:hypothetical protein
VRDATLRRFRKLAGGGGGRAGSESARGADADDDHRLRPTDWIVHADADEFLALPTLRNQPPPRRPRRASGPDPRGPDAADASPGGTRCDDDADGGGGAPDGAGGDSGDDGAPPPLAAMLASLEARGFHAIEVRSRSDGVWHAEKDLHAEGSLAF